jgi:hypothetical protein
VNHATSFYKNLFGPSPGNLIEIDANMSEDNEKLSEEDNINLCRPFSMKKLKKLFLDEGELGSGP